MSKYVTARYVSVWDGGTKIVTKCEFDTETKELFDVECADPEMTSGLEMLEDEYVLLEDGTEVRDFWVTGNEPESLF